MRFLIISRQPPKGTAVPAADAGSCDFRDEEFSLDLIKQFMQYNEEMTKAGVLVASEGLNPEVPAIQVGTIGGRRAVIDGPFAETKELVGGFYLIDVASREEAIAWALKCPLGLGHETLEIRQLTELSDLPSELQTLIRTGAPVWSSSRYK